MSLRVVLEVASKRSFASSIDWPGWSRGGRTPEDALQALVEYAPRYGVVAARAGTEFDAAAALDVEIVERLAGDASTEFGVPAMRAAADVEPLDPAELERLTRLLEAAWDTFDATARAAAGVSLRLGPRGGGRQVPKIVEHVAGADGAYLSALGSRAPVPASQAQVRRAFVEAVTARALGRPLGAPSKVRNPWPPQYAIRRSAWHALDHAWEIEDRSA